MSENRRSPRLLVLKTGTVRAGPSFVPIYCAVLNLSMTGACILVSRSAAVPDNFELAIDRDVAVRSCTMVWRKGPLIGLRFDDNYQAAAAEQALLQPADGP
jgi:hypothetical protein